MNKKARTIVSIILKLLIFISTTLGILGCVVGVDGFMGGSTLILYFTNQSNIWIALVALILAIMQIVKLKKGTVGFSKSVYLVQQVFTVSISLTCIVYCFVLVPSFLAVDSDLFNPFALTQMLLHVVTPLLAIIDFIFSCRGVTFKKADCLWSAIPPLYYLGFSAVGYVLNWNFGMGNNFPLLLPQLRLSRRHFRLQRRYAILYGLLLLDNPSCFPSTRNVACVFKNSKPI